MFNRYIKNLEMNPLCPLCRREFNEDSEVKKLTDEVNLSNNFVSVPYYFIFEINNISYLQLKGRLQKMPVELERVENELSNITKRHETALQLKPLHEQINIMCTEELPRFRSVYAGITKFIRIIIYFFNHFNFFIQYRIKKYCYSN